MKGTVDDAATASPNVTRYNDDVSLKSYLALN